jgi:hypothetical protein
MKTQYFLAIILVLFLSSSFVLAVDTNNDTNSIITLNCPPVATPMCAPGTDLVTIYDSNNCVEEYACEDIDCPGIIEPICDSDEILVSTINSNGCPDFDCEELITCAMSGEPVFIKSYFGPTQCCNTTDGIKPVASAVGNGSCVAPTNGQAGTCIANWQQTCGDGLCKENDEDSCNCPADCDTIITECTQDKKICSDGSTVERDPSNNCKFNECPIGACTMQYDPVCAEITICTTGSCITNTNLGSTSPIDSNSDMETICTDSYCFTEQKTYGNECQAKSDGAKIIYYGECDASNLIKETVKCVLDNARGGEKCYSSKGNCIVDLYDNGTKHQHGACTIDIRGKKGETVTWKSDCGGYAHTIIDGQNKYAKFRCNPTKPPVIFEDKYMKAKWKCTNDIEFGEDSNTCKPYSYWKNLAIKTCDQYSTKCGITTDANNSISSVTNSSTKCVGGRVTVEEFEVNEPCDIICTTHIDSQGCTVTKCTDREETTNCPIQACRIQPIEEIKKIKKNCTNNNGQVIVEVDEESGCTNYICALDASNLNCNTIEDIPTEKMLSCEDNGGQFVYNTDSTGCLVVADCVGIRARDRNINQNVIQDSTKLLELALKLESLKISLEETKAKITAMAEYYNTNNDSNNANNFTNAANLLDTAIQKIDTLKEFIKSNVDNFSEEDAKQVRNTIAEIKEVILKDVLLAILG